MAGPFATWVTKLRLAWMGAKAKAIMGGFAAVAGDRFVEWTKRANYEHLPEYAADPASVGLIASERRIDQGPSETTEDLAARLTRAVQLWRLAGTPLGLLVALHFADFPGGVIVQQNGLGAQLTGSPVLDDLTAEKLLAGPPSWYEEVDLAEHPLLEHPWFVFDRGQESFCSRFAVLFPPPSLAVDGQVNTALVSSATSNANLGRLRRTIAKWKPAKATCVGIFVAYYNQVSPQRFFEWPPTTFADLEASGVTFGQLELDMTAYPAE
jgi:hypothetical protein